MGTFKGLRPAIAAGDGDILVVDDDTNNLMAMEAALGDLATRLVAVCSGEQALRKLLEQDYAVILLDVQMPTMDGFETARLIRTRGRSRHVPIIFVTAHSQNDIDMRKAYELGAVDYLFKPIIPEVLRAKVQVFVELRERTAEVAWQAERLRQLERAEGARRLEEERQTWEAEMLRRQNQRLEEADRRKNEFIAVLAHELRNPLTPLVTGLQLLHEADDRDLWLKVRDAMTRQVHHLVRLVDDLLDVARISQGKMKLACEIVHLQPIVERAIETCRDRIETRRHDLDVAGADQPVRLYADSVRLTQVIVNLLNNAILYTEPGGRIWVKWEVREHELTLRVRDTGRGIDPDLRGRIFDMFVQERDSGNGLGLGLTLVKQVVDLHGGTVTAHSDGRNMGSEFVIRLPVVPGSAIDGPAAAPPSGLAKEALRIALVEDDEDVRNTTRSLIEHWGHEVVVASTGRSGIALVLQTRPDVALLDVCLPEIDGYGVARQIRKELGPACPRLVAITGYGQAHDQKRAFDAGFDAHLVKPARPVDLRKALRKPR